MYINLVLAVFWLVLGLSLFFMSWAPGALARRGEVFGVSTAWVAVLLALYNLLRFASCYSVRTKTQQPSSLLTRQPRSTSQQLEYDPTFDFSNPPVEHGKPEKGQT